MDKKSQESQATADYLKALERLEELRRQQASADAIDAAKAEELKMWDRVKELMPDAFCR